MARIFPKRGFPENQRSQPKLKPDFDTAGRCSPSIVFGKVDPWRLCRPTGQSGTRHSILLNLLCF
jgi:hypothetical protein